MTFTKLLLVLMLAFPLSSKGALNDETYLAGDVVVTWPSYQGENSIRLPWHPGMTLFQAILQRIPGFRGPRSAWVVRGSEKTKYNLRIWRKDEGTMKDPAKNPFLRPGDEVLLYE